MEHQRTQAILEALLFGSEQPLSLKQLRDLLPEVPPDDVKTALDGLIEQFSGPGNVHGVELAAAAGGYRFRTRADLSPWVRRMYQQAPLRLGRAMLETLAVVAYRQPVTRAEIEAIRGVDSAGSVKALLDRDLIRIVGKKDMPGRPVLFGTTRTFLEVFDLKNLADLPPFEEDFIESQPTLPLPQTEGPADGAPASQDHSDASDRLSGEIDVGTGAPDESPQS